MGLIGYMGPVKGKKQGIFPDFQDSWVDNCVAIETENGGERAWGAILDVFSVRSLRDSHVERSTGPLVMQIRNPASHVY